MVVASRPRRSGSPNISLLHHKPHPRTLLQRLRDCLGIRTIPFLLLYVIIWAWWKELQHTLEGDMFVSADPPTATPPSRQPLLRFDASLYDTQHEFCVAWNVDTDEWWTHHPDWEVTYENATHYCFGPMVHTEKAAFMRNLYHIQFPAQCNNSYTREMVNQGWGADLRGVYEGLSLALEERRPVQFVLSLGIPWIYTVGPQAVIDGKRRFINEKAAETKACPSLNMECYFLPVSGCPADLRHVHPFGPVAKQGPPLDSQQGGWIFEYATRTKTILRERVYRYASSAISIRSPCTVMHVRRADVVINPFSNVTRRYYPIDDYIQGAQDVLQPNILLLTDDQNAISEAEYKFPQYHWMYLNRTRHRGAEGGFENQIPSGDPVHEVVILLTTFRLVRSCASIVHTFSSFPYYLRAIMQSNEGSEGITRIDLDDKNHASNSVWKAGNHAYMNVSKAYN